MLGDDQFLSECGIRHGWTQKRLHLLCLRVGKNRLNRVECVLRVGVERLQQGLEVGGRRRRPARILEGPDIEDDTDTTGFVVRGAGRAAGVAMDRVLADLDAAGFNRYWNTPAPGRL